MSASGPSVFFFAASALKVYNRAKCTKHEAMFCKFPAVESSRGTKVEKG